MIEEKSSKRARHPELYRDGAVYGVDYVVSHTDVFSTTDGEGRPNFGICIERVPVLQPQSAPLSTSLHLLGHE